MSFGSLLVRALEALPGVVAALPKLTGAIRDAWRGRRPHAPPEPATGMPHLDVEHIRRSTHGHQVTEGARSYWCPGPDSPNPCPRCRASGPASPRAITASSVVGAPRPKPPRRPR